MEIPGVQLYLWRRKKKKKGMQTPTQGTCMNTIVQNCLKTQTNKLCRIINTFRNTIGASLSGTLKAKPYTSKTIVMTRTD